MRGGIAGGGHGSRSGTRVGPRKGWRGLLNRSNVVRDCES